MDLVFCDFHIAELYSDSRIAFDLSCSDGAAALVLVSGAKAKELGLQVIAKIRGYADAALVGHLIQSTVFKPFKLTYILKTFLDTIVHVISTASVQVILG